MTDLVRRLQLLLTTDSQDLQRTEFLLAQLRILHAKYPGCVPIMPAEKLELLRLGKPLGAAVKELVAIVTPRTFMNWLNAEKSKSAENAATVGTKGGRPPIKNDVREMIARLARENGWGYTRIKGELAKLRMYPSRSTIVNVLKENGFDIGPERCEGTWSEFLKRHADTLWACDFFSKKVVTAFGVVEFFVLFFVHVGSRRVHIAGMSMNPDAAWSAQQARNVAMFFGEQSHKPTYLLRDNDSKFGAAFDSLFEPDSRSRRSARVPQT